MLKEINKRPPWATRTFDTETADFVDGPPTIIEIYDDVWYFGGPLGAFLADMIIPRKLEIHCDMQTGVSYVRMIFEEPPVGKDRVIDGQNADGTYRVLYSQIETLSVAMLWNHEPPKVHGLPNERMTLFVDTGPTRVRFVADNDLLLDLTFQNGDFTMSPVNETKLVQQLIDAKIDLSGEFA